MNASTKHNVLGYFHYVVDILSLRLADPSSRGALPSVGLSLSVIRCNSHPLHLQWVGRKWSDKKDDVLMVYSSS
jgi:hypothetical protein